MTVGILVAGIGLVLAGLLAIGYGFTIKEFSTGNPVRADVIKTDTEGLETGERQRLGRDVPGRRALFGRLQRAQEGEELRISPIARVVPDDAQRLGPVPP